MDPIGRHRLILGMGLALVAAVFTDNTQAHNGPPDSLHPPLPVWPSDQEVITERTPVFRLNGRSQATKYRVEVARDDSFANPIVINETQVLDDTGIAPVVIAAYKGEPLTFGKYYWRAFCGDDKGTWTPAANYRAFTIASREPFAIVPPEKPVHPRLFIRADEIDGLRKRIEQSEHLRRGWNHQVNAAYSALDLNPPDESYAKSGSGQHGYYATAASWYSRHLTNVAFVGLVKGDRRLIEKAVDMLIVPCTYETWVGPGFSDRNHVDPIWPSTLESAMMTEAVATGYDLLYRHLTNEQRATVVHALAEKGIRPLVHDWADPVSSATIPRHQLPSGNWVMVCSGSAGIAALALLGEHPEAPQCVRHVRNRVRAWFADRGNDWSIENPHPQNRPRPIPVSGPSEANFGIDGGYKESIGYMNYGTRYACFFADALRRQTGEDLFECIPSSILDSLAWSIMTWPVDGKMQCRMIDFGDDGGNAVWFADLHASLMIGRHDGLAAWLYRRTIPVPTTPRTLIWSEALELPDRPPDARVPMRAFRGIGQVVMRSGWSPDTPMAAIKFHQNRGHHDIGNVFLFGAGQPTLIDSGSVNYGSPLYRDYSSQSVAHNLVLVDQRGQQRTDGTMLATIGTPQITAASGELRKAYPDDLKTWTRDLVMLRNGPALIFDRLEGKRTHQFDLVLHPENPFAISADGELTVGGKNSTAVISVYSNPPVTAVEQDGYYQTLPRKYMRFNANGPAAQAWFLTICRWHSGGSSSGVVPVVQCTGPGQWQLDWNARTRRIGVRVGGSAARTDDFMRTDARLAAVSQDSSGAADAHAVVLDGSHLLVEGKLLFKASKPINVSIEPGFALRVHVWTPQAAEVQLLAPKPLSQIDMNGRQAQARREGDHVRIDVPAGESIITVADLQSRPPPDTKALVIDSDLVPVAVPDAPAFHPDVRTRTSSCWTDGVDALDGDLNTDWVSLIGLPMPQWLEVALPKAERANRIRITSRQPCAGRVEARSEAEDDWTLLGRFQATADKLLAEIRFADLEIRSIRVIVEQTDASNDAARISSLDWDRIDPQ